MHDMYEMHNPNYENATDYGNDLERQNERLRQQLEGLGIDPYDGAGTSIARPSAILSAQIEYLILMLVKFTIQVPQTQAEYLYGLASSQRLFTMQVTNSWRVSIYNKYANVCMICM